MYLKINFHVIIIKGKMELTNNRTCSDLIRHLFNFLKYINNHSFPEPNLYLSLVVLMGYMMVL